MMHPKMCSYVSGGRGNEKVRSLHAERAALICMHARSWPPDDRSLARTHGSLSLSRHTRAKTTHICVHTHVFIQPGCQPQPS